MGECRRNWDGTQYYSIDSYTSITSFYDALRPAFGPKRRSVSAELRDGGPLGLRLRIWFT
jgi:hypothetical protein